VAVELDTRFESSDSAFRSFRQLEPRVRYERRRNGNRLILRGAYASLEYDELDLRSFRRLDLRLQRITSGGRHRSELGLIRKSFPGNAAGNYLQFRGRWAARSGGLSGKHFSVTGLTRLYSERSENSHSELRLDLGGQSSSFYNSTSLYGRFWHDTGSEGGGPARSHVVDVNEKLGIIVGGLRIGPALGLHALLSSAEGESTFERDGNLVRLGGSAEGDLRFGSRATLSLSAGYEYGFVYSEEFAVDPATGAVTVGEVSRRHPTTLQIAANVRAPLTDRVELIGLVRYYKIKADTSQETSLTPVTSNNRLTFQVGLRFRKD
jgi:hypothetical protein